VAAVTLILDGLGLARNLGIVDDGAPEAGPERFEELGPDLGPTTNLAKTFRTENLRLTFCETSYPDELACVVEWADDPEPVVGSGRSESSYRCVMPGSRSIVVADEMVTLYEGGRETGEQPLLP
jgi:hypothetical protein